MPRPLVHLLGAGIELRQAYEFLTNPTNDGHSAFGKPDFADNDVGATCPANVNCKDQCSPFTIPPMNEKTEEEFGPFYQFMKKVFVPTAE